MTESYKLIKSNGDELEFNNYNFYLESLGNLGNPDISYITQKGYFQDGAEVTNFTASERQLSFGFLASKDVNDRIDYWNLRREILSFLSPVSGAMRLQITLDDHTIYELFNVYPTNGLSMDGNTYNPTRNDGRIQEPLKLTAFDPIWKKLPINSSGSISPAVDVELVFPTDFPIEFGGSGIVYSQSITYDGTWRSYPKITIKGPYNTATIVNGYNNSEIQLIRPISINEYRIIDLTNPTQGFSITDINGNSKLGEINLDTNFAQFYFVPDETNSIQVSLLGGSSVNSAVSFEWYTQLLGI